MVSLSTVSFGQVVDSAFSERVCAVGGLIKCDNLSMVALGVDSGPSTVGTLNNHSSTQVVFKPVLPTLLCHGCDARCMHPLCSDTSRLACEVRSTRRNSSMRASFQCWQKRSTSGKIRLQSKKIFSKTLLRRLTCLATMPAFAASFSLAGKSLSFQL